MAEPEPTEDPVDGHGIERAERRVERIHRRRSVGVGTPGDHLALQAVETCEGRLMDLGLRDDCSRTGRRHGESCKKQGDRRSSREAAKQVHERLKVLEVVVTNTRLPRAKPVPNRKHAASTCSAF